MATNNPELVALVNQQTEAFNQNATEAERVRIYQEIQKTQKEIRKRDGG